MLKRLFIRLVSLAAAISALLMMLLTGSQLDKVFRLTDPTGLFGSVFCVSGFLASVSVLFLFSVLVCRSVKNRTFLNDVPVLFVLAFCLMILEAVSFIPCTIGKNGDSCGMSPIMLSSIISPLVFFITVNFILRTTDRNARRAGLVLAAVLAIAGAAAWWRIAPKSPGECLLYPKITAQASCLDRFALSSLDIQICRQIEFRPARYDCMKRIAERKQKPELCEEIQTPAGAKVLYFEVTAEAYRDVCYYQLAIDLRKTELCGKIQEDAKMKICLEQTAAKPAGGK